MVLSCRQDLHVMLIALYLPGAPRPMRVRRAGWRQVHACARRADRPLGGLEAAIRQAGHWEAATVLSSPGLLAWAEDVAAAGSALTAESDGYPATWCRRLGDAAPPALWSAGAPPSTTEWIGVVGSRGAAAAPLAFAAKVAAMAGQLGCGVVSGGAAGVDTAAQTAAVRNGVQVLCLVPRGLTDGDHDLPFTVASAVAPSTPFTAGAAMERNALIYAAAQATVVADARLREGGTWHGATAAIRRQLCPIIVREDPQSAGLRALQSLGATPLADPSCLGAAIKHAIKTPRGQFPLALA